MIITSTEGMNTPLSHQQGRIRGLTGDAKWAADKEIQKKRSIDELGALGPAALASLEEVMAVTSREEIRRHHIEAIRTIERKESEGSTQKRAHKNSRKLARK